MGVSAHTLRLLMAAGLKGEELAKVFESIDADMAGTPITTRSETAGAKRTRRWRERHATVTPNVTVTDHARHGDEVGDADPKPRADTTTSTLFTSTSEQEPPKENPPTGVKRKGSETGTRIPADWQPDRDVGRAEGLSEQQIDLEAARFRDYWRGIPGHRGRKLDWLATWRNWCRKPATGPPRTQQPRQASNGLAAYARKRFGLDGNRNGTSSRPTPEPQHSGPTLDLGPAPVPEPTLTRPAIGPPQPRPGGSTRQ